MKRFILFLTITAIIFAAGVSTKGRRYIIPTTIFRSGISDTDSLHQISPDTLKKYLRNSGFLDSLALADSITAIKTRTAKQIKDSLGQEIVVIPNQMMLKDTLRLNNTKLVSSNGYLDIFPTTGVEIHDAGLNVSNGDIEAVNNTIKSDSVATDRLNASSAILTGLNVNGQVAILTTLLNTETTQGGVNVFTIDQDSVEITKNNLIFGNNAEIENDSVGALKLHADSLYLDGVTIIQGATTIDNIVKVNSNLTLENNAIIDNSAPNQLTITEDTIVLNPDSTYAVNVFKTDTAYVRTSRITNKEADSLKFDELNSVFKGNLKTTGLFSLTNGTTTTFTQSLNRLTIAGGDSLSIRNMTNINPYRATSPQTSTFIGMLAGKSGTTGADNFIGGYQAGNSLTSGNRNVYIGSAAGFTNSTGNYNSFYGFQSGYKNLTGTGNVFSGYYSGNQNSTGNYNSFYGFQSGRYNIGSYNSFYGTHSCVTNTTGSYGVALGDSAGYKNTIGSNNIFLGYKSGGANTTGNRNIFIGDFRGYNSADSMLYIENTGKDSTSTPLIAGNMGSGVNTRGVTIDGIIQGGSSANYAKIDYDGTITLTGNATAYLDEMSTLLSNQKVIGAAEIINADSSCTVIFTADADTLDFIYMNIQLNHDKKLNSAVYPHLHYIQTQADSIGWQIAYRLQKHGAAKDGTWKWLETSNAGIYTYTSGALNQMAIFPAINAPTSDVMSDILQIKLARKDDVAIEVHALSLDVHKEVDSIGSRTELMK